MAPRRGLPNKKTANAANGQARRRARLQTRIINWTLIIGVLGAIGYGISQMSNIVYDDNDIKVVNFSGLDEKQKRTALESANGARCNCGCGMTLAQCVSTDMTCPIRDTNVEKIKTMVRLAQQGT